MNKRIMKLIHGDAIEEIKKISDDVFIFSDPPYNQGYHYNLYNDKMAKDEYVNMIQNIFGGRKSVIIHYPEEIIQIMGGGKFDLQ